MQFSIERRQRQGATFCFLAVLSLPWGQRCQKQTLVGALMPDLALT